jgi:membrane protein
VPAVLVVVAMAGYTDASGGDAGVELGEEMRLGEALRATVSQAGADSSQGWQVALVIGLIGVLSGGYSLYGTLFRGYAQLWELSASEHRKRFSSSARFIGGLLGFIAFLCLMAWIRQRGTIIGGVGVLVSILAELALFLLLSVALPHRGREWFNLVPGAVAGGLAVVGLQIAAATWLPNQIASRSQTYGALGVALALLAYLALLGSVLVLVPLVNATWYQHVEGHGESARLVALAQRATEVVRRPGRAGPPSPDDG